MVLRRTHRRPLQWLRSARMYMVSTKGSRNKTESLGTGTRFRADSGSRQQTREVLRLMTNKNTRDRHWGERRQHSLSIAVNSTRPDMRARTKMATKSKNGEQETRAFWGGVTVNLFRGLCSLDHYDSNDKYWVWTSDHGLEFMTPKNNTTHQRFYSMHSTWTGKGHGSMHGCD